MTPFVGRFLAGLAGVLLVGWAAFRGRMFVATEPAFNVLVVGAVAAAILSLQRTGRAAQAVAVAVGYTVFQLTLWDHRGALYATSGAVIAAGLLISGWIFDRLARGGWSIGKFLVLGPLFAGVLFAVAPMMTFHSLTTDNALRTLLVYLYTGLVTGHGVGIGIEAADLVGRRFGARVEPRPEEVSSG